MIREYDIEAVRGAVICCSENPGYRVCVFASGEQEVRYIVEDLNSIFDEHHHNLRCFTNRFRHAECRFLNGSILDVVVFSESFRGKRCNEILYSPQLGYSLVAYNIMQHCLRQYQRDGVFTRILEDDLNRCVWYTEPSADTEDSTNCDEGRVALDNFLCGFKIVPENRCAATTKNV